MYTIKALLCLFRSATLFSAIFSCLEKQVRVKSHAASKMIMAK
jgi:hypothetical protein